MRIRRSTAIGYLSVIWLIGCGSSPSGTRLGDTGLSVVVPVNAEVKAIEENRVYRIDWKDDDGKANRAVVSLIEAQGSQTAEDLARDFEQGLKQSNAKFEKLSDTKLGKSSRRLVFRAELADRQNSENTSHLILGRKIAEVILLHPGAKEPTASQDALAASISGFE